MRLMLAFLVAASMALLAPRAARAQTPDPAAAFFTGALVFVGSFTAGGLLLATSNANSTQDNAGWLAMDAGFIVAPLASHALVGQWSRGLIFAAPPAAMTAGTAVLMDVDSGVIAHGSLPEQRVLWSLFGAGLLSGAVGVVDATFARERSVSLIVTPGVAAGRLGLELRGIL